MRSTHLAGFLAVVIVGSSGITLAQSARDEEGRERSENNNPDRVEIRALGERPTTKMTWLGISVEPISPPLMHHLKLPPGVGLMVEQIIPGSPAQKAGLEEYDILQKFADQLLVNPEQLSTLVHMQKSGDIVTLSIIHHGEPKELKVTLGEQAGAAFFNPGFQRGGGFAPGQGLAPGQGWMNAPGATVQPQIQRKPRDTGDHVHEMKIELPMITIDVGGGEPRVTARDAKGNVLFSKSWKLQLGNDKSPLSVRMSVEEDDQKDGAAANPPVNILGKRKPEARNPEPRNPEPTTSERKNPEAKNPAPPGSTDEK